VSGARGRGAAGPGLLRRLDRFARAAFPAVVTALLMVLASAPAGLPAAGPAIAFAAVFFWSVFRPAILPPPAVFALGLLQDLLGFAPLGTGVLTLLLVHGLALRLRGFLARRSFVVVWLACGVTSLLAAALGFVLHAALTFTLPGWVSALAFAGLATGLYPVLALPFTRLHRAMQRDEAGA
jgi:rod shape-determining protein MreD